MNFQGERASPNAVWPHPQQITASTDLLYIRPHDIPIDSNIKTCDIIQKAIERYQPIFFPPALVMNDPPAAETSILQSLTLNITGNPRCEQQIELDSNETCESKHFLKLHIHHLSFIDTLTISEQKAVIEGSSVWGLLRGLETFSQLIYINQLNYV